MLCSLSVFSLRNYYRNTSDQIIYDDMHAFLIWLNPSLIVNVFVKRLYFQFLLRCEIKMPKRGRKTFAIVAPKYQSIANFSRIKDIMKHQFIKVNYDYSFIESIQVCSFNRSKAAMILRYAFHPISIMKSPYISKAMVENPISQIIIRGTVLWSAFSIILYEVISMFNFTG